MFSQLITIELNDKLWVLTQPTNHDIASWKAFVEWQSRLPENKESPLEDVYCGEASVRYLFWLLAKGNQSVELHELEGIDNTNSVIILQRLWQGVRNDPTAS